MYVAASVLAGGKAVTRLWSELNRRGSRLLRVFFCVSTNIPKAVAELQEYSKLAELEQVVHQPGPHTDNSCITAR